MRAVTVALYVLTLLTAASCVMTYAFVAVTFSVPMEVLPLLSVALKYMVYSPSGMLLSRLAAMSMVRIYPFTTSPCLLSL